MYTHFKIGFSNTLCHECFFVINQAIPDKYLIGRLNELFIVKINQHANIVILVANVLSPQNNSTFVMCKSCRCLNMYSKINQNGIIHNILKGRS